MAPTAPAGPGQQKLADSMSVEDYWFTQGGLRADEIRASSHAIVWMICDRFHVYKRKATIHGTAKSAQCPVCTNQTFVPGVNDFATTHPAQSACFIRPGPTGATPETRSARSRAIATWRCDHGHEFITSFAKMAHDHRNECSCNNHKRLNRGFSDLASRNPVLAAQFDTERNGTTPDKVDAGSHIHYWWTCPAGHHFQASPKNRMTCGKYSNGCRQCYRTAIYDPALKCVAVDPSLRPTPDEYATYFRSRPKRARPDQITNVQEPSP
ncbi:zinc-ribbon domain-containing protein [Gordonia sp. VNK21]|uniref:zinc-ribbon domain-containing protein n=1 Tax=Gordonia sp. VNK21 TaxID=3382483 RepID=UPI0038D4DD51